MAVMTVLCITSPLSTVIPIDGRGEPERDALARLGSGKCRAGSEQSGRRLVDTATKLGLTVKASSTMRLFRAQCSSHQRLIELKCIEVTSSTLALIGLVDN